MNNAHESNPHDIEPVPFSERAAVLRRAAREQARLSIERIEVAGRAVLAQLAETHGAEMQVVRTRLKASLIRAYTATGAGIAACAMFLGTFLLAVPPLENGALNAAEIAVPETTIEMALVAPAASGEALAEPQSAPEPAPVKKSPTRSGKRPVVSKPARPAKPDPMPALPSVFQCTDDKWDPLNPCL